MIKNRKRCLYSLSDNSYPECDRKSTGRSLPSVTRIAHRADVPKHKNVYYRAMWSLVSAGCARKSRAMHPGVLQSEEPFGRYDLRQTMITLVPMPETDFPSFKAEWISLLCRRQRPCRSLASLFCARSSPGGVSPYAHERAKHSRSPYLQYL